MSDVPEPSSLEALTGRLERARREITSLMRSVAQSAARIVVRKKALLATSAARLNALSPLATLSRGYAVARDLKGGALTSATQFSPGLAFQLLLHDGRIAAQTKDVSTTADAGAKDAAIGQKAGRHA